MTRPKMMTTTAMALADAAMAIARVNHYMVNFSRDCDGIAWDDWHDAKQLLIERESEAIDRLHARRLTPRAVDVRAVEQLYSRAFAVLAMECKRQHNCEP